MAHKKSTTKKQPVKKLTKSPRKAKHGHLRDGAQPPEYAAWKTMVQRCRNPKNRQYKDYGALGVRVCERWLGDQGFASFFADVGPQPFRGAGLVRLEEGKGYEPGNVVWGATRQKMLTHEGRTMSMADWARELGIEPERFCRRIRTGWTVQSIYERPRPWKRKPYWTDGSIGVFGKDLPNTPILRKAALP